MSSPLIRNTYYQATKIQPKFSKYEGLGLGVIATKDIKKGELIERCPLVPLARRERYQNDEHILKYVYCNPEPDSFTDQHGNQPYLVLGYGMLYNHQSFKNNATWEFDYKKYLGDVRANKKIKKGEEIFVNYGENYFKKGMVEVKI
tara:strand:+ start:185 stop:622 length:438 start_codon:yes stop_codon:yes gene_type:complete